MHSRSLLFHQAYDERLVDIVYSQPADTGTGNNINTQLVYAVNHLKVSQI